MTPTFEAPDGATWSFDASHQTHAVPRLFHAAMESSFREGFADGFADVGALLETLELRYIHGWAYLSPHPVGAPRRAGGPPPRLLFRLLNALHPALRARNAAAATAFERRPWATRAVWWNGERGPWWVERLRGHQRLDPRELDDRALAAHLRMLLQDLRALSFDHFSTSARSTPAVGDFLVAAQDRGVAPAIAIAALNGSNAETSRPRAMLRDIAEAVRRTGTSLEGPPAAVAARLREDSGTAEPVAAYLEDYGWRVVDPDEFLGRVLHERPELLVASVRGALESPRASSADAAARFLERLEPSARRVLGDRLEQARAAASTREHSCSLFMWVAGLVRRTVLELGGRWQEQGRAPSARALYHLVVDELDAPPSHSELVRREAEFAGWSTATPPARLGPDSTPPPVTWLPEGQQRLTRAVVAFVERFDASLDRSGDEPLAGIPASAGVVEGRAHQLDRGLDGLAKGDILVARTTTPALNGVLPWIGGLVTERGGLVSHAAIVSRELGFPGVVGCNDALGIPHGAWIRVDGTRGRVEVLAAVAPDLPHQPIASIDAPRAALAPAGLGSWVWLAEASDSARFGGKAAHLARALAVGHPVPTGIALDTELVQGVAAGSAPHLAQLEAAIEELTPPLAVRSSAPAEDGADASFAGVHHTELGVTGFEAVVGAVAEAWRSAHGPGARAYRERLGMADSPSMAVILQTMVDARAAGVRFGRDPVTGEDVRVIEAAPGLGVSVVEGRVRPDRARLTPDGRQLELVAGDKPVRVVLGGHGVREEAVPDASASTLDPATLARVHALGEACDALFDRPQDVEWALDTRGVWLLQSRPLTHEVPHA
ncbi:MAG: hypothetical protein H6738_09090 [Alphaproteobacteria bacterium]|nr:hypothetical protein [Alphaproteobacteria bacterium]MCB9696917.1 hypothetical protein [Alphaproteobacteria bacterium]